MFRRLQAVQVRGAKMQVAIWRVLIPAISLLPAYPTLAGCHVSKASFDRITLNMSVSEVERIAGCHGVPTASNDDEQDESNLVWDQSRGDHISMMVITVTGGRVTGKDQIGLKGPAWQSIDAGAKVTYVIADMNW